MTTHPVKGHSPSRVRTGRNARPFPIALLTDFGPGSVYVGVMHGVIVGQAPRARVIDLAHNVQPQNVVECALDLEAAVAYFPSPTVFCCVVDPGVGTERRAVAVWDGRHFYVAPDNGLLTLVERLAREDGRRWEVRMLDPGQIESHGAVSATFHGRDLFAPAAAALALGGAKAFRSFGPVLSSGVRLDIADPAFEPKRGEIVIRALAIDPFGNVITNLRRRDWDALGLPLCGKAASRRKGASRSGTEAHRAIDLSGVEIRVGRHRWRRIARTFGDVAPGWPVAYWGSGGRLEIAVRDGNAARRFSIVQGTRIVVRCGLEWRVG